jgi:heptose I phosphotransferase
LIWVRPDARALFPRERTVADFFAIAFQAVRRFENRSTGRFVRDGRAFYIKLHQPRGWWPIVEELLHLRRPQTGARHEWRALRAAADCGVPTPPVVAYGEEGRTAATQRSFLITEEIAPAESLESLFAGRLPVRPGALLRRRLVIAAAGVAARLHRNGINHRDFYLGHFLIDTSCGMAELEQRPPRLFLIDLHRAQTRRAVPPRWVIKDLAGLLFSALDAELSSRDLAAFARHYAGRPLRSEMQDNVAFWRAGLRRADRLWTDCIAKFTGDRRGAICACCWDCELV